MPQRCVLLPPTCYPASAREARSHQVHREERSKKKNISRSDTYILSIHTWFLHLKGLSNSLSPKIGLLLLAESSLGDILVAMWKTNFITLAMCEVTAHLPFLSGEILWPKSFENRTVAYSQSFQALTIAEKVCIQIIVSLTASDTDPL